MTGNFIAKNVTQMKNWYGMSLLALDDKGAIKIGTITRAEDFPEARKPAYRLWVDFGPEIGERKTSAQITLHYTPEELPGRKVLAVVNFPPKQIGKFMSECLVLGVPDGDGEVVMIRPDLDVPDGGRIY